MTEWTWDKEGREIDLHLRAAVEFFATPIFAIWFRALSETDTSWSYKLLTLKPCMAVGEWSFCVYLSQFLVWGTTHLLLGRGGVTLIGAANSAAMLPEWTRHLMVIQCVIISGVLFNVVEEPARRYLNGRIDEAWKPKELEVVGSSVGAPVAAVVGGARFDPQTGEAIPKFDPYTGAQNW